MSPNSYTWRDFDKQHLDWCKRRILAPFREVAKGQPWEADATKFMEEALAVWSVDSKREKAPPELMARGRKLLGAHCNDPMVRYLTQWLERVRTDQEPSRSYGDYEEALQQLEKEGRYPRAVTRLVAINLFNALSGGKKTNSKSKRMSEIAQQIVLWTREALEEGSYDGADDMLFVQHTVDPRWWHHVSHARDELAELYSSSTKLAAWAKHTLLGYIEVRRAWEDRGSGWASTVTEQGWAGFSKHLKKARAELTQGWQLRPDRPEAAAEMITVVMGGCAESGDSLRLWFDRAVKAQFDYRPAYSDLSWALQPRWGGSHEAMLAFGRACAATKRYDTRVPDFFFDVVQGVTMDFEEKREVYRTPQIADDVMALEHALLAAPERKNQLPDRLSSIVVHGWACGRYDEARKALDQLHSELAPSAKQELHFFRKAKNTVIGNVYLFTSAAKDDFGKGMEFARAHDYAAAAKCYQSALQKINGPESALQVLRIELAVATGDEQLSKGGWVDVSPKAGHILEGWDPVYGKWEVPTDGVFQIRANNERVLIVSQLHVGTDLEVRADFEIDAPTDEGRALGVALGYSWREGHKWVMCEVWKAKKTATPQATLLHQYSLADNPKFPVTLEKKNQLHVQCWKNHITFYLNGNLVFKELQPKEGSVDAQNARFGFGAHSLYGKNTTRISNIQVRLLKEPPPSPDGIPSSLPLREVREKGRSRP
ncbi:MAG: hypothetical protein WCV00_17425 [Verrucomicrobiia bacterium]